MKCLVGVWYLYALVITASYAGEIRSFFTNPGTTSPLDTLAQVVQSPLPWGLILYGEEEEKVMAASTDPIISQIWSVSCHCKSWSVMLLCEQKKEEVKLDETYAVLKRVAAGEFVFLDYKNGVGAAAAGCIT